MTPVGGAVMARNWQIWLTIVVVVLVAWLLIRFVE
jgi:hypothetical protein